MRRAKPEEVASQLSDHEWQDAFQMWIKMRRTENTRRAYLAVWHDLLHSR